MARAGPMLVTLGAAAAVFAGFITLGVVWFRGTVPTGEWPERTIAPPDVLPPEARVPWRRDADSPKTIALPTAPLPWVRRAERPVPVTLPVAEAPWEAKP